MSATLWKNGFYVSSVNTFWVYFVDGQTVKSGNIANFSQGVNQDNLVDDPGTWTNGIYGETCPEIMKMTNQSVYTVEMISMISGRKQYAVVDKNDSGRLIKMGFSTAIDILTWVTEDELLTKYEQGEFYNELSTLDYKPKPKGKLIWVSGSPGSGKSTVGLTLSKGHDFVYYEGDSFLLHTNPYVSYKDPWVSLPWTYRIIGTKKFLKGLSKERLETSRGGMKYFGTILRGGEPDEAAAEKAYSMMCETIATERERLGGDWVIAQAVPTRRLRDCIRKALGPDLMFVTLSVSRDLQLKRSLGRSGSNAEKDENFYKTFNKFYNAFEPVHIDEPFAFDYKINHDLTPEEICRHILTFSQK